MFFSYRTINQADSRILTKFDNDNLVFIRNERVFIWDTHMGNESQEQIDIATCYYGFSLIVLDNDSLVTKIDDSRKIKIWKKTIENGKTKWNLQRTFNGISDENSDCGVLSLCPLKNSDFVSSSASLGNNFKNDRFLIKYI